MTKHITKPSVLLKLAMLVTIATFIWLSPLCTPELAIKLVADTSGISQLYTNKNNIFSEDRSQTLPITTSTNNIEFRLSETTSPVRWDPSQSSINAQVISLSIGLLGLVIEDDTIELSAAHQIKSVKNPDNSYTLKSDAGVNDPQISISFDERRILIARLFLVIAISLAAVWLAFNMNTATKATQPLRNFLTYITTNLKASIKNERLTLKELFALVTGSTILNSYFITTLSLSIDDEMGATRTNPEIWVSQGRWLVYLIERFLIHIPAIPFLPYLILSASLAFAYMLILRIHGAQPNWKSYLTFPIFCAFPTWWMISEFASNIPAVAFGTVSCVAAAYVSARHWGMGHSPTHKALKIAFICLAIATSIAAYQSLILLYLCICLGSMLTLNTMKPDQPLSSLIVSGSRYLTLAAGGMVTYFLINRGFQEVTGTQSRYLSNFINFSALITSPLESVFEIIAEAGRIYTGQQSRFGAPLGTAAILLIASTAAIVTSANIRTNINSVLIWLLLLMSPFLIHFMAGAGGVPMRTMISLAYVAWLMAFSLLTISRSTILLATGLVGVYLVQTLNINSQYIASATLTQRHDEMLAADIYRRIGEIDSSFDRNAITTVDFFGHKNFVTVYAQGWTSTTQASFFDWDNGNAIRMLSFMKILGVPNLKLADAEVRKSLTKEFLLMPVWPAAGSVAKLNDIYLVRLSSNADPAHH